MCCDVVTLHVAARCDGSARGRKRARKEKRKEGLREYFTWNDVSRLPVGVAAAVATGTSRRLVPLRSALLAGLKEGMWSNIFGAIYKNIWSKYRSSMTDVHLEVCTQLPSGLRPLADSLHPKIVRVKVRTSCIVQCGSCSSARCPNIDFTFQEF